MRISYLSSDLCSSDLATADFSRRGAAYTLTRFAAADHDGLRRRAGADTVEENARDTLPAAGRDTHVGWPASPFEGTAGKRLPRAVDAAREAIADRKSTRLNSSH